MQKFKLTTLHKKMLADVVTPVSIYLKLRDKYANSILLESSDYHGNENSFSYICCNPIAQFKVDGLRLFQQFPNGVSDASYLEKSSEALDALIQFSQRFEEETPSSVNTGKGSFITNGLFGYMTYDAVRYFEDISFDETKQKKKAIPEIVYQVYRHVIVIDHFKNELHILEHTLPDEGKASQIEELEVLIRSRNFPVYSFHREGEESSNFTDAEYMEVVKKGKEHCYRGDVFQIVLSRRFQSAFKGDEFNVYRTLRSINPSPYLFYFDYGGYKLFGSSPEAQIMIKGGKATIFPIAGTFKRTGNDQADAEIAQKLIKDPKENAEHVMLVDLARNDLSRNGSDVTVETYKELQYYSHLIHLVSKVTGMLGKDTSPLRVVADTFPAGTLSGAPKYKAMELIDRYETVARNYYGGAVGFLGFQGDFNHCIMIRSFLSQNNKLHYQAGAGIVAKSMEENELQEVNHKLAALRQALKDAELIG